MRRLIIVLVIVAALLLASPLLTGQIAEKELKAVSGNLSRQMGVVDVVEVDYHRGWFESKADHKFVIPPALMGNDPASDPDTGFAMHTEVMHGPLIVGGDDPNLPAVGLALAVSKTTFSLDIDDGEEPYEIPGAIYNRIALDGSGTLWGVFDSIEKPLPTAGTGEAMLTWGGGRFETHYNSAQTEVNGTFVAESLVIESPDGVLEMGPVTGNGEVTKSPFGFWIGKTSTQVESMEVSAAGEQAIVMNGFSMDASTAMQGEDKIGASVVLTIADLDVPEFNETKIRFPLDLTGLDAETVGKMNTLAQNNSGNPEDLTIYMLEIQELSNVLLQHGFGVAVPGFEMETQQGNASLDFSFDIPESGQPGQAALMSAMTAATGSAELKLDRTLFEFFSASNPMMMMQAGAMIDAGFLTEENGVLILNAGYEGGLLTINGMPIPLPIPGGG